MHFEVGQQVIEWNVRTSAVLIPLSLELGTP